LSVASVISNSSFSVSILSIHENLFILKIIWSEYGRNERSEVELHSACYMLRFFLCFDRLCPCTQKPMAQEEHTGLDFDGTVTDVEREALPYSTGYKVDMAQHLGIEAEELERIWNQVAGEIQSSPGEFGWRDGGTNKIVAPATADPLLLTRVTAEQLLSRLKDNPDSLGISPARAWDGKLPQDAAARHELLELFFDRNYGKLETHFRDGAADFLMSLLELGRLTVITNSKTKGVQAKLAELRKKIPLYLILMSVVVQKNLLWFQIG